MADHDPELRRMMGEHIKAMLDERGWKQQDLARYTGITEAVISNRLRGNNEFTASNLVAIAKAFGVSVVELFPPSVFYVENGPPPGEGAQRRYYLDRLELVGVNE